jgi:hypothetical protein
VHSALTLNLTTGQVLNVSMSEPAHLRMLTAVAVEKAKVKEEQDALARVYHTGSKRRPGLDYDDRLSERTGLSVKTLHAYLSIPVAEGGIRHTRAGSKYIVTEQAVREWLGDRKPTT